MTRISALTALTSADAADTLPILDDSATTTKKITKTAFLSDVVDGTLISNAAIKAKHVDLGVADQTARDAIATPWEGLTVFREDTDAFEVYDGTVWLSFDSKWQTYTPAIAFGATDITVNNGTLVGRYKRSGKSLQVIVELVIGSTTSIPTAGTMTVSMPFTMDTTTFTNNIPVGIAHAINSGLASGIGYAVKTSSSRLNLLYSQYGATANAPSLITNTAPFTPGTADSYIVVVDDLIIA